MLRARQEGVVQRSKEAECTFHGGVVPANAQRAPLLPEKPLQTMPNRVHTLQGLMYSIFLEKHRAAMVSGSAWALTAWSTTPPPTRVHQQNLGPTLLIPFPAPFLMVSKGRCFHISLPQNKTGIFLVLHGTYCTLQFIIFIQWGTQPNWHHHMSRQNPLRSAATHFPHQHHTAKWDGRKKMVHGLSQHPPNTTACGDTNTEPP